jgi:hypothetical protein
MCHFIAQAVWDYQGDDLDGTQTAILSRMAWYASWSGIDIYPSIHSLSRQTKFTTRTIERTLKYLRDKKFIIVHKKANKSRHMATNYRINFEKINMPIPIDAVSHYKPRKVKYKSVDNRCKNTPPTVTESVGATVTESVGATVTESDKRSLIKIINKDHMIGDQQNDILKAELVNVLLSIGFYEKDIIQTINSCGVEYIFHKISDIKQLSREGKIKVNNVGAYLRKVLKKAS